MRAALRLLCSALLMTLASACASPRYVGSIGRNDVYSNRGFGVLVDLSRGGVLSRWRAIDPSDMKDVPLPRQPKRVRKPLDIDGDGFLQVTEATVFYEPTLRLISKTSSVAHMDLEVEIVGSNNAKIPLDAFVGVDLKQLTESSTAASGAAFANIERRTLPGEVPARIAEVAAPGRSVRLMVADVPRFVAEEKQVRRHVVRFRLTAPTIDDQMRADFDALVSGMLLAPQGARAGTKERW